MRPAGESAFVAGAVNEIGKLESELAIWLSGSLAEQLVLYQHAEGDRDLSEMVAAINATEEDEESQTSKVGRCANGSGVPGCPGRASL